MLTALLSLLSFLGGLWSAVYLQDRHVRRRHLGIVRALRAELRRVESEAGLHEAGRNEDISGTRIIPHLAPWVQGLLSELASGDTDYLSDFMNLDRCLHSLALSAASLRKSEEHASRMSEQVKLVERTLPDDMEGIAKCRKLSATADVALTNAEFVVDVDRKHARSTVSRLLQLIDRDEPLLASAMRTHLPWGRRLQ